MTLPRTGTLLRESSFRTSESLRVPLNDLLQQIQDRIQAIEQRPRFEVLGPQVVTLPLDGFTTRGQAVDFAIAADFTPTAVFVVALESNTQAFGAVAINPAAIEYEVVSDSANGVYCVRVHRITTATAAGQYRLTLGALE